MDRDSCSGSGTVYPVECMVFIRCSVFIVGNNIHAIYGDHSYWVPICVIGRSAFPSRLPSRVHRHRPATLSDSGTRAGRPGCPAAPPVRNPESGIVRPGSARVRAPRGRVRAGCPGPGRAVAARRPHAQHIPLNMHRVTSHTSLDHYTLNSEN